MEPVFREMHFSTPVADYCPTVEVMHLIAQVMDSYKLAEYEQKAVVDWFSAQYPVVHKPSSNQ